MLAEIFIPHGHCYLWKPTLVGLHLASDALIALAYYSIPLMLIYFVQKRRDVPFNWIFLLFGAFIVFCGTGHLIEIWTLWHPTYWLSGFVKASTATVSLYTAGMLVPLIPKALALPSPAQLAAANQALQQEIRERIEAEQALKKSEALYRGIVEDQTELICRYLPDGSLTFVNGAYCRYFGKNRDQLLGQAFIPFVPDQNRDQISDRMNTLLALTPTRSVAIYEHQVIVNGEIRWQRWSNRAIFDEQDNIIEFQSVGLDITEHKLAEELRAKNLTLEAEKRYAESANRAKSEFLANMTHELRTPLNAILGFTQLLVREPNLTPSQHEQLSIITHSGEHLLELINDVLEMSKIEAGRTVLNPSRFDLYRLIDSLEEMLQLKARSKGLHLIFDLSPDVPQYVQTDESKLRQVLINLLGNAIKFTEAGSVTLCVSVVSTHSSVVTSASLLTQEGVEKSDNEQLTIHFEVEDTGPGIAPDELATLFNAFVQTETGRNSQEGTGLGLAISQKFVELMGGKLTINSSLGQGTTAIFDVLVTLVREADTPCQAPKKRAIALAPNQPTYRILVVEDRWENRHLLVKLLQPLGFEVLEASNGQEGVALWESWEPHLILMDMRMPVMDGYEATKRIKAHIKGQATVIIAITASVFDDKRAVVMSAGCDDFVRKPFRESVLLEKIAAHLGVQYVYEDSPQLTSLRSRASIEVQTKEALAVMPPSWISQLYLAAVCGDYEQMLTLLDQIPETQSAIKSALADLVNNFRFDLIIDLTQDFS
ncbi:MAG: response regulator [Coleofasciculus sp. S288]|nr:response regulator [Coleofasciculus sp. S288]